MSSLQPGFEYDIFISYRHKDNKGDHWVTEFVKALRAELDATFKEDISIYFDENPHDGLLETHNVDKSLEGKLKCLIFLPIISQTYCDCKCYAWQHEFCAFNKLTSSDIFGRDIKLGNGNVASRILPVKIHSLDANDRNLMEAEIGSPLRAIDFIYHEPGVNRPLRLSDFKKDNQAGTDYRNQVNKVANAIRELMQAMTGTSGKQSVARQSVLQQEIFQGNAVAVLPLENMSSDPEQEYFSDGITEDIIAQISKIRGIRVISRTSVIPYKRSAKAIKEIALELNVTHILEGSVRKSGNRIRIVSQLIHAASDAHLWAESFDRDLNDVFAVQSEIAEKIAGALQAKLTQSELSEIERKPTTNMAAYDFYLLGLSHYHNVRPEDFDKAMDYFRKAISLDKNFALAKAACARTLAYRGAGYWGIRPNDIKMQALQLVEEAIALDPKLALAYEVRAVIMEYYFYEWEKAEKDLRRAIELNPNLGFARLSYGFHLIVCKQGEEGVVEFDECLRLDPHSINFRTNGAFLKLFAGRTEAALQEAQTSVDINPGIPIAWAALAFVCAHMGLVDRALAASRKAVSLTSEQDYFVMLFHGYVLARAGLHNEARALLAEIHRREISEFVWPLGIALTYAHLGENNKALDYLEKSYEERVGYLWALSCDPTFKHLHSEPRLQALLKKIGPR